MRRQTVLEIEDADQLGLFQQRQAKQRPYPFAAQVFIFGKHALSAGVIEDHLALRADDLLKDQQGQFRRRHRRFDKTDPDAIATARRSRLDPVLAAARKEQEAAVGPGMLNGYHHQRLDQLLEHDLAGHGLRHLDDRGEIKLLDQRLDGRLQDQRCLLSDSGVALVELCDLCLGAPAGVAVAGLVQIDICHLVETAKAIESSCQFARERAVLEEAALRGRANCPFVQLHGLDVSSFEACPFRRDQGVFMRERRRAALRPPLKRRQVCNEVLAKLCLSLRRGRLKDCSGGERVIKAEIHRLKIETGRPENRLRLGGKLKGSLRVAQQEVPLQLQDPVKAGNEGNAAPEHSCFKRRLVEGRAAPRSAAKALDETLNAQDDQLTKFVFTDEIQGIY